MLCAWTPAGSFPDFFTGENCDFLQCGGDAVIFDYYMDPNIIRSGRLDMLTLKRYTQIRRILVLGARYAARLEAEGEFDRFALDHVRHSGQQQQQGQRTQQQQQQQHVAAKVVLPAQPQARYDAACLLRLTLPRW